jgi:hypothetical protein
VFKKASANCRKFSKTLAQAGPGDNMRSIVREVRKLLRSWFVKPKSVRDAMDPGSKDHDVAQAGTLRAKLIYLCGVVLTIGVGCGHTDDAGIDAAGSDSQTDATVDTAEGDPCTPTQGCCCLRTLVPCDSLNFTYDASFNICTDGGDGGCVASADCTEDTGALSVACETGDIDAGDQYFFQAGNHFTCQVQSTDDAGIASVKCRRFRLC